MRKVAIVAGMVAIVCMLIGSFSCAPAGPSSLIMGVGKEGSFAYVNGVAFSRVVNTNLPDVEIDVSSRVGYNTCYIIIGEGKGELDLCSSETETMCQLYRNEGEFADVPKDNMIYAGMFGWPFQVFVVTMADRDDINSFSDLAGKKVCPGPPGTAVRPLGIIIFDDIAQMWDKVEEVQFGSMMDYADALKSGAIDACIGYTAGSGVPSMVKNYDAKCDLKVIPFTKEELDRIAKVPSFIQLSTPAKQIFAQDVGVDPIVSGAPVGGFAFARHVGTDVVYEIVKCWWEHQDELVELVPQVSTFRDNGEYLNNAGMDAVSLVPIPIHPGAAKYYKERGWWKDSWVEGKVIPLK